MFSTRPASETGPRVDSAAGGSSVASAPRGSLQPLPDSQYNGNPESVGYRVKYWRPDLQSPARAHVVHGRLERECAIEELEEWTEYELQLQAFNAVGAGPWSEAVRGRTRESGETGPAPATPPWAAGSSPGVRCNRPRPSPASLQESQVRGGPLPTPPASEWPGHQAKSTVMAATLGWSPLPLT